MTSLCPHCKRPMESSKIKDVVTDNTNLTISLRNRCVRVTLLEFSLFKVLKSSHPNRVTSDGLIFATYNGFNEPDLAYNTIRTRISILRKKLKTIGLTISAMNGVGYKIDILKAEMLKAA